MELSETGGSNGVLPFAPRGTGGDDGDPWLGPELSREQVLELTMAWCSCGGLGEDDPESCPACLIYHSIRLGHAEVLQRRPNLRPVTVQARLDAVGPGGLCICGELHE